VGTLVHRLLEHAELGVGQPDADLACRAAALVRASERAGIEDVSHVVTEAVGRFREIASRPGVQAVLASGTRHHEVPFLLRREGEIVHGTIDSLVESGDAVTVVEFKTGRPAPEHRQQIAVYLDAARMLFPGAARVCGLLVYPGEEQWFEAQPNAPAGLAR
jgi:ATP-dependent helicase/nuclease subunit A